MGWKLIASFSAVITAQRKKESRASRIGSDDGQRSRSSSQLEKGRDDNEGRAHSHKECDCASDRNSGDEYGVVSQTRDTVAGVLTRGAKVL